MHSGESVRRFHEAWLNWALSVSVERRWPRIPVRRVSEGGYTGMMKTESGRAWAELWWETALLRLEDEC